MMVKETVAVVGIKEIIPVLVEKLFEQDLNILLINNSNDSREALKQQLNTGNISADVEVVECAENGCWEADIILIFNLGDLEESIINRIKKVSIQKIVAVVMEEKGTEEERIDSKSIFPLSKVVSLFLNSKRLEIIIKAEDEDSADHMKKMLKDFDLKS